MTVASQQVVRCLALVLLTYVDCVWVQHTSVAGAPEWDGGNPGRVLNSKNTTTDSKVSASSNRSGGSSSKDGAESVLSSEYEEAQAQAAAQMYSPEAVSAMKARMQQLLPALPGENARKATAKELDAQMEYLELFNHLKSVPPLLNPEAGTSGNSKVIPANKTANETGDPTSKTETRLVNRLVFASQDGQFYFNRSTSSGGTKRVRFFYTGTNLHSLAYRYWWTREQVDRILKETAAQGFKVIRIWCFNDSWWSGHLPLQTSPGVFDEESWKQWDWVFHRAAIHNVRVICTLSNNWDDYGGKKWWTTKLLGATANKHRFYHSPKVVSAFQAYIEKWVNRVNTFNGMVYKNDPVIFSWQLQNEPAATQYEGSGKPFPSLQPGTILRNWVCRMSSYIRSLGARQMISVGDQGYRSDGRSNLPTFNWVNGGYTGVDFVGNLACADISFGTVHYYPRAWGVPGWNASYWARDFLADRAEIAAFLKKPITLEEFGLMIDPAYVDRLFLYTQIRRTALFHRYAGFMIWEAWPTSVLAAGNPMVINYAANEFKVMRDAVAWSEAQNEAPGPPTPGPAPTAYPCVDRKPNCPTPPRCNNWDAGDCLKSCDVCKHWNGWDAFSWSPNSRPPRIWQ